MDRRERTVKLASGVYARFFDSGRGSIRIEFSFRGVHCKETLRGLDPGRKNHVKWAMNRLASVQDAIDRGTFNYLEHFPDAKRARIFGFVVSTRTVKDVAKSWLADQARSCEHSTYRSYAGPVKRWIYPAIGDLRVRDVTVEHVRDMFRNLDVSLKTARNYSIPLAGIFQRAVDDDDIERSPMDRISIKSLIPKSKHDSEYECDPFEEAEIARILEQARAHRPGWVNYLVVAFYTGMRTSELYGLRWSDVDWRNETVRVQRAIVERKAKDRPKTKSSKRDVAMCELVVDALKRQRAATELLGDEIFRNPRTGKPLDDYEITQRALDYCCRKAGIRRRNQYQTRHTFASHMLSGGENPLFVAHQLGHKNVKMLFEVYAKWIPSHSMARSDYGKRSKQGLQ